MARGKQTDNETVYKIMLSYFTTGNFSETARQLNLPQRTVEDIYKRNKDKEEFTRLRVEKTEDFIAKANRIIDKALNRLEKEIEIQRTIPVNQLSTVVGILVDKRNLAEGKATSNTDINIKMNKEVEELSK